MQMEIRGAERLSFREKQVVTLKEMGQATDKIAKQLHISASSVATIYNRAKSKGYQVVIVLSGDPLAVFSEEAEDE